MHQHEMMGWCSLLFSGSLQIRSIPSPNSLTYLYALRYWAILGLREKWVWRILSGRISPGKSPEVSKPSSSPPHPAKNDTTFITIFLSSFYSCLLLTIFCLIERLSNAYPMPTLCPSYDLRTMAELPCYSFAMVLYLCRGWLGTFGCSFSSFSANLGKTLFLM